MKSIPLIDSEEIVIAQMSHECMSDFVTSVTGFFKPHYLDTMQHVIPCFYVVTSPTLVYDKIIKEPTYSLKYWNNPY